ncbi:unnamed protein product [Euphydryas editha]|uniref:Uncharacterized protein n=1 Tax=Euphydryas editha TaxID=104508 RepID=A0AAU9UX98_EUPED|nr:unnamed protein product [Euphydryas editha]
MAKDVIIVAGPSEPSSASSSIIRKVQINAQNNGPQVGNSVDLVRLLKIEPPQTKRDIMRNRQYYLTTHPQRYKLEGEYETVQKWIKDSKEYVIVRPYSVFVRDTESEPSPVDPDIPMPFEIKKNWDRPVAIKRIKELFKELDDILHNKQPSNPSDETEVTARLNLEREQDLLPSPPPHINLDRY